LRVAVLNHTLLQTAKADSGEAKKKRKERTRRKEPTYPIIELIAGQV